MKYYSKFVEKFNMGDVWMMGQKRMSLFGAKPAHKRRKNREPTLFGAVFQLVRKCNKTRDCHSEERSDVGIRIPKMLDFVEIQ